MRADKGDEDPAAPMLAALARAPEAPRLTPEERAELDQIVAEMAAGQFVRHEDVPAALEAYRPDPRCRGTDLTHVAEA